MNRHILTAVVIGCCLTVGSSDTLAQRNVSRGSSSNSASSHLAITQMLQTLDTNRNGMLDLSETNGRTRVFVQRAGLDPNKAHSIAAIARALSNQNKNDKDKKSSSRSKKDVVRKVPGFGVDVELVGIKDFSPSGEERMSADAMNRKFGASIMSQVDKTMSRYDSDKNGVIDQIEQKRTRWSNPSAEVSDTNKDGGLSRLELAYRYKKREDDSKNRLSGRSSSRTTSKTTSTPTPSNSFRYSGRQNPGSPSSSKYGSSGRRSSGRSTPPKASSSSSAKRFDSTKSDAYRKYAEGLFKNYDKNKDGRLSKEEIGEMRRPPKNADANKDGFVDKNELINAVTKKSGGSSSDPSKSSSSSAMDSKRRSETKSYNAADSIFGGKDLNSDGQLQMSEFTNEWTDDLVMEFREKDFNNDGVITEKEWRK